MKDKLFREFFHTKCEKDYKGEHFWERRGVIKNDDGELSIVWQCTQCEMCNIENLEFITALTKEMKK